MKGFVKMISINNKLWNEVTADDIKTVLSGNDEESLFYEFKSDYESPKKLLKEILA